MVANLLKAGNHKHYFFGTKISFNCSINSPLPLTLILLILSAIFSTYSISFSFHNIAFSSDPLTSIKEKRNLLYFKELFFLFFCHSYGTRTHTLLCSNSPAVNALPYSGLSHFGATANSVHSNAQSERYLPDTPRLRNFYRSTSFYAKE